MTKQVLLYLPVIHKGYEDLLARHADADGVLLMGRSFAQQHRALAKDIRALDPERAAAYVQALWPAPVRVVERADLPGAVTAALLVAPDEDVLRATVKEFGLGSVAEVTFERTFLRWDRPWSLAARPVTPDLTVSRDAAVVGFQRLAAGLAARSSDWWRQVGAVAVRDGEVLGAAYNEHAPTEYGPYTDGDPRDNFSRGVRADLSTATHAEARLVGTAARDGVRLSGADLHVTTFPCPACARLVADAGFARCFFTGPYAVLDGEQVLRAAGVGLVWVDDPASDRSSRNGDGDGDGDADGVSVSGSGS